MSSAREQQPLLESQGHEVRTHEVARQRTKRFLTSKTGHYAVLGLVSLDVTTIFVTFLLQLLICEGQVAEKEGDISTRVLEILGLICSYLFIIELSASIWSFGWKVYFGSWFHCFDATVIVAAFVVDVLLKGVVEEIGSLVIIMRGWRVFKIIEELSAGAQEQMGPLLAELEALEKENCALQQELDELRRER